MRCRAKAILAIAALCQLFDPIETGAAQTSSVIIGKIAAHVKIDTTAIHGANLNITPYRQHEGKKLRVRTNAIGDICHIGYRMFDDEVVASYPDRRVFDFVERYVLELRLHTDKRAKNTLERLALDDVTISPMDADLLFGISENTPVSIDYIPRRMYRFTWTLDKDREVSMSFKADSQLIIGAGSIELETLLSRDVQRCSRITPEEAMQQWRNAQVTTAGGKRILSVGNYLSETINSNLYMNMHNSQWGLMLTPQSTMRSLCNIMLTGGCSFGGDAPLCLIVDRYGYRADTLHITLGQMHKYFFDDACRVYIGAKRVDETSLYGTLFVVNEALGYDHVVSFECPLSLARGISDTIKSRIYTYIPMQHVTEKFFNQYITPEVYE